MCANGPAKPVRIGSGQRGLVDQGVLEVLAAQHRHQAYAVFVVRHLDQVVDDPGHLLAFSGDRGVMPALTSRRLRVAEPLLGRVQERQVGHRPGLGVLALQFLDVTGAEPGGAQAEVGGYRPQVPDEVSRFDQRPPAIEGRVQVPAAQQRFAEQVSRDFVVAGVHQDRQQRLPDLVARLVVRSTGFWCAEGLGPVVGAQPDVGPVGLDHHPLGRRLLVEPDGRLDRLHQAHGRLQAGHVRVGLDRCRGSPGDEIPQSAGLHALFAEAGQDVADVGQIGLVRTDEQHAAPAVAEARVGVEEVGRAVQGDDGLARARAAVDHESAAGSGADDRVLVGLDGAEHVSHPGGPAAAQAGDEGGLVVERSVPVQPVRGEHFIPVVADPGAGPAVPAAAGQTHRVGVGRSEERLSRGGAPVRPAAGGPHCR